MGHVSPTAPTITGRLWNGENSTSAWLPDFSISDGPALQPCPSPRMHMHPGRRQSCPRAAGFGSRSPDPACGGTTPPAAARQNGIQASPPLSRDPARTVPGASAPSAKACPRPHLPSPQVGPAATAQRTSSLSTVRGGGPRPSLRCLPVGKVEPSSKPILPCPEPAPDSPLTGVPQGSSSETPCLTWEGL